MKTYLRTLEDFLNSKDAHAVFEINNDSLVKETLKLTKKLDSKTSLFQYRRSFESTCFGIQLLTIIKS